jgi:putative hemolysin
MTISPCTAATRSPSIAKGAARAAVQPGSAAYQVAWARSPQDVTAAQRLRHEVFAREMGARLQPLRGTPPGHDADRFDAFCQHLLLLTVPTADEPPIVVGTCRVMTPAAARRAGGFYSDTEFGLAPLRSELQHVVELGRSCVHVQHRSGNAVMLMWSALVAFVAGNGLRGAIGCASVSRHDGGHSSRQPVAAAAQHAFGRRALPRAAPPAAAGGRSGQLARSAAAHADPRRYPGAAAAETLLQRYSPSPNLSAIIAFNAFIASASSGPSVSISIVVPRPAASIITPMMLLAFTRRSLRDR